MINPFHLKEDAKDKQQSSFPGKMKMMNHSRHYLLLKKDPPCPGITLSNNHKMRSLAFEKLMKL